MRGRLKARNALGEGAKGEDVRRSEKDKKPNITPRLRAGLAVGSSEWQLGICQVAIACRQRPRRVSSRQALRRELLLAKAATGEAKARPPDSRGSEVLWN